MLRSFLALVLLAGLVSLGTAQEPKPLRVGFVASSADDLWTVVEHAAAKAAADAKVELIFKRPEENDIAAQEKLLDELAAARVEALVVSPVDTVRQAPALGKLARTTALGFFDTDWPETGRALAVASDHKQGGQLAGKLVKEALPKGATVAVFVGASQSWGSRERFKALRAELGIADPEKDLKSKDGKYRLLSSEPWADNVDPKQAKDNAAQALERTKDAENVCLVGLWGYNPPAILAAVQEAGRAGKVTIIGFEEHGGTLRGVIDGSIYATVAQDHQAIATKVVAGVVAKARKQPVPAPPGGLLWVPHRIITKDGGGDRLKAADRAAELQQILGQ